MKFELKNVGAQAVICSNDSNSHIVTAASELGTCIHHTVEVVWLLI